MITRLRAQGVAIVAIFVLGSLLVVGSITLAAAIPVDVTELGDSERDALHATIKLLEWGLIVVSGSLVAALGILWRSSLIKDKTLLDEVKAAAPAREGIKESNMMVCETMRECVGLLREMRADVKFCRERRGREEAGADPAGGQDTHRA